MLKFLIRLTRQPIATRQDNHDKKTRTGKLLYFVSWGPTTTSLATTLTYQHRGPHEARGFTRCAAKKKPPSLSDWSMGPATRALQESYGGTALTPTWSQVDACLKKRLSRTGPTEVDAMFC